MNTMTESEKNKAKLGLYIHIPFCMQKCRYCDFHSFEQSDERTSRFMYEEYTQALINEITAYGNYYNREYVVDTVFIGGGTPSIIAAEQIARITDSVLTTFDVSSDAEITIESNPGTLDKEKLNTYINSGINRISMGVQSLDDRMLKALGRIHDARTAINSYELIRECGFKNVNLDMMFSIPDHTQEVWEQTMEKVIALNPEHISFYSLQLEENTPFFDMYRKGEISLPTDEEDRLMYHSAVSLLKKAGYEHYEISNAAKPGYECKHNLKYWSLDEYLGLGLASHSYFKGLRFYNCGGLQQYIDELNVENGRPLGSEFTGHLHMGSSEETSIVKLTKCVEETKENNAWDDMSEFVFTGLRKTKGFKFSDFKDKFGREFFEIYPDQKLIIEKYCESGYVELSPERICLTEKGIDISNRIMSEFV